MSVDRAILSAPVATPQQRERLRDAALGGAITQTRAFRMVLTTLAIVSIYAVLVFREVALVNALEAGRAQPPGFSLAEPAALTWQTIDLPASSGLPTALAWDDTRSEFQLPLDSSQFVRIKAATGERSMQALPFRLGPDVPVVLQPGLLRNFWPGTDGQRSFFLTSDNTLATVHAGTLKLLSSAPALPERGAPNAFTTDYPFWHVAFDNTTDRLVIVVRDRTEGQVQSFFQFQEPKSGFSTLQHFAVDGAQGAVSYAIDGLPSIRRLSVSGDGILHNTSRVLAPAPFPDGSTDPARICALPLQRLMQLGYGDVGVLAQVHNGPVAALRPESPMVVALGTSPDAEPLTYYPRFTIMPANGMVATRHGVVLLGSIGADGEVQESGLEIVDLESRTILRTSQFDAGAIRLPDTVAALPLLAVSPDGHHVAIAGPQATQVWIATITPQSPQ